MDIPRIDKRIKYIFVFVALIATLVPAIFTIGSVGGWSGWQGVLPRGTTDSSYYYARIHEVMDGHPLIGNPYVYEYRDVFPPAFFLPDIISAVPMLLGVPFNIAVMINLFVWSFVFLMLSATLFRLLQMPKWWAFLWSILLYFSSYSFMIRPTVMQIVFPVFLMFLIALLKFLYEPFTRCRVVWLALAAAATFYVYAYLSYIVLLTFIFIFFWFLFARLYKELRALVIAGFFTALLLIPFGIFTLVQMKDPYYLETFSRIGLVHTRIPAIEAFFFGRWIIIGLIALGLLWAFFPQKKEGDSRRKVFWLATGASLFVGLCLNVITGVELTLAVHVGRFVVLWMVMILGVGLCEWYTSRTLKTNRTRYIIIAVFLVFLAGGAMRNVPRRLVFFNFNDRGNYNFIDIQSYAAPLKWLDEHVSGQSVIWANESIAEYIPIMTRHYPLFFSDAALHSISSKELEDRYLLSRSLNILTTEDIKHDFGLYSGAGPLKLQPLAQNQRAWLCETIARFGGSRQCPSRTDPIALRGEEYFKTLAQRFGTIKKNQTALLQQFNVKYLIIDRVHDNLKSISMSKALYDDGRFVILPIPLLSL